MFTLQITLDGRANDVRKKIPDERNSALLSRYVPCTFGGILFYVMKNDLHNPGVSVDIPVLKYFVGLMKN